MKGYDMRCGQCELIWNELVNTGQCPHCNSDEIEPACNLANSDYSWRDDYYDQGKGI